MVVFWFAWWLVALHADPSDVPEIKLRASSERPYFEQLVRLDLEITTRRIDVLTVRIPWLLEPPAGWHWMMPIEQWLCQHSVARSDDVLTLDVFGLRLHAPRIGQTAEQRPVYRLTWWGQFTPPDRDGFAPGEGRTTFEPITLAVRDDWSIQTQALTVTPRRWPILGGRPSGWFCGVGALQVEARIDRPRLALGEDAELTLLMSGEGDLQAIPIPRLSQMPGWSMERFIVEPGLETWRDEGRTRLLRFRLEPRREMNAEPLPPLVWSYLDPEQDRYIEATVPMPALTVLQTRPPASASAIGRGPMERMLDPSWKPSFALAPTSADSQEYGPWSGLPTLHLWPLTFLSVFIALMVIRETWAWWTGWEGGWFGQGETARQRRAERRCRHILMDERAIPELPARIDRAAAAYISLRCEDPERFLTIDDAVEGLQKAGVPSASLTPLKQLQQVLWKSRYFSPGVSASDPAAQARLRGAVHAWMEAWRQDAWMQNHLHHEAWQQLAQQPPRQEKP